MSEFDVYLGGQGFMLAKDSAGQIAPGAHREQVVDPFTLHLSRDEPYQRIPFGFEEGGGLAEYDGSARYEWGRGVDTRSGKAMPLPERAWLEEAHEDYPVIQDGLLWHQYVDKAHNEGIAQRYQAYLGCAKIRSVSILVRRSTARDYAGTTDPTIEIWSDSPTEPKPNAQLASLSFSLIRELPQL